MTAKQRFLKVLNGDIPDRLPVMTHHVMPWFLENVMNGISVQDFFDRFGLDPINWITAIKPDESNGEYIDREQSIPGYLEPYIICSDKWRVVKENIHDDQYQTVRYSFQTPGKTLSMATRGNSQTTWVIESLIKDKHDIEVFAKYAPVPLCDVRIVNRQAEEFGEKGLVRGCVPGFDVFGQPGCWQDAVELFGMENLIMETFSDPEWVHLFLKILMKRKKIYIESMKNARFDIVELGGGSASSTVISPSIFDQFVAPYNAELIESALVSANGLYITPAVE